MPPALQLILLTVALLAVVGLLLWQAQRRYLVWRRVMDTPTARLRSAPMGLVELGGLAQPLGGALAGPFSGLACCWWRITVEQEEVTRTKNSTKRQWKQIHDSCSLAPFYLEENGARLRVDPAGADVQAPRLLSEVRGGGMDGLMHMASGWLRRISNDTSATRATQTLPGPATLHWASGGLLGAKRRLREWRIDVLRPLYVLGTQQRLAGQEATVGQGRHGEPFIISTESESELLRRLGWGLFAWVAAAALVLGLGLWALAHFQASL